MGKIHHITVSKLKESERLSDRDARELAYYRLRWCLGEADKLFHACKGGVDYSAAAECLRLIADLQIKVAEYNEYA